MGIENAKPIELKQAGEILHQQLKPLFRSYLIKIGESYHLLISALNDRYVQHLDEVKNTSGAEERIESERAFKKYLLNLLNNQSDVFNNDNSSIFINNFLDKAKAETEQLKNNVTVNENFVAFPLSNSKNPILYFRKLWANIHYYTKLYKLRSANVFRKLFKKELHDTILLNHRNLPLQKMAQYFLVNSFLQKALPIELIAYKHIHKGLVQLWEFTEQLDKQFQLSMQIVKGAESNNEKTAKATLNNDVFEQLNLQLNQANNEWLNELETIADSVLSSFADAFAKADTVELPLKTYRQVKLDKGIQKIQAWHLQKNSMWHNTRLALFDDWAVDVEVTLLFYSVFDEFNFMRDKVRDYVEKHIGTQFESVNAFFKLSNETLSIAGKSKRALLKIIADEKHKVEHQLIDDQLTLFIEKLTGSFDPFFEELIKETNRLVEQMSENRGFIRNKNYYEGVPKADVKHISPRELLKFEALPVFIAQIKSLQRITNSQLEKMRINIMGLGTVSNFALESAQLMLEADGNTHDNAIQTVNDGYSRALRHLQNAEVIIQSTQENIALVLSKAINQFNYDILKLKNTDNIFELNLKIARIKALEQTKQYKKQLLTFFTELLPRLKNLAIKLRTNYQQGLDRFRKQLGISVEKKFLSFELSEFINQSQQNLQQLPFVYQRLFQLKPTDEDRFFVNRDIEIAKFDQAFQNWSKDRFVTVALIGDKGSGITSLINFYLKKNQTKLPVFQTTLDCKIYKTEKYYSTMAMLFGKKSFQSNSEIIDHLNSVESNCIVVIENLQHMFLKKVNGFDCMNLFFELMAHTMKKVLWIGVYTNHSWRYLERTIHVSNYFTDEIYIEPMSRESIEEIIFKRNHMSGFQIVFEPDSVTIESKAFQKLDDIGKQEKLRSDYFTALSVISSGNISLSQLYWLRSTKMNSSDTITIAGIKEIDFSFIKKLSGDELFVMQALVIHDGLELEDFALVMNKPIIACRNLLTPLFEKGLLIKPKTKYNIHPLIFRPLVVYLASKNFVN